MQGRTPELYCAGHTLCTTAPSHISKDNLLVVPKTQLHYGDIKCTVAAEKMWNKLPALIKLSGNVNIFKKYLKRIYLPKLLTK